MSAAGDYAAMIDAVDAQRTELGLLDIGPARWSRVALSYVFDPHRSLDPNLERLASLIEPGDEVVDVGGGAGRIGLPLALRCRSLLNVEPAPGMADQFETLAKDAGIENARVVRSDWLAADGITGDVVLSVDVTYFVREIEAFLAKMTAAARRRAALWLWDPTPPNRNATLFEAAFDTPLARTPGPDEVRAVLAEMGIAPETVGLPEPFAWPERGDLPRTPEETVDFALEALDSDGSAETRRRIADRLDGLFTRDGGTYVPAWRPELRGKLITWNPLASALPLRDRSPIAPLCPMSQLHRERLRSIRHPSAQSMWSNS